MTDADDIDELHNHLRLLVFDQKHMTGRGLRFLREQTGLDEFSLAIFICVITSVYLMVGEDAQMLANAILTVTPILLTYVFPAEKPPTPQLLIYWYNRLSAVECFVFIACLQDRSFESS
ncbi:hypothetical protein WUBG_18397 [Wuchereria bancrofti]|uniref:Uncharacterized protein n=1 Tax=Wuchereria bancrofti TaxID=6293 RepID=J9DM42_WUCBA|nr:hypothetical protein WUBG_18397 [Wuchereria bancrofti]